MRSAFHAAGMLLTLGALAACDVGFYWQAAGGQMEILGRRWRSRLVFTHWAPSLPG